MFWQNRINTEDAIVGEFKEVKGWNQGENLCIDYFKNLTLSKQEEIRLFQLNSEVT